MLQRSRPKPVAADEETVVALLPRYRAVRAASTALADGLFAEDTALQSMPDASPGKWHLAHTTWFFEQFVLGQDSGYCPYDARWHYLFNSYYQSVGPMHARPQRGMLSRPTLQQVLDYRAHVDARMTDLLAGCEDPTILARVTLGLHHEQQHQELFLTDLKHLLSLNPLEPAYRLRVPHRVGVEAIPLRFIDGPEGVAQIGHEGDGFAFDCETPRHRQWLHPHALANRPVSNGEYREFIRDGGYRQPALWLSEGWNTVQGRQWQRPMYWSDDLETEFTLAGRQPLEAAAPVCHLSYFEADAYARWAGARLPSEAEWEVAAAALPVQGQCFDRDVLHPRPAPAPTDEGLVQLYGDVWEWTSSPYGSYPGYRPLSGALGEYNGKFMCGQYVLRGGSCVTPDGHLRATYRNFFMPPDRWQFSGLRLAIDR